MDFLRRFQSFIIEHQLCQQSDRILLGLSGGKDSVLLLHLLAESGYDIGIAHAHFGLRDVDADLDLQLAREYASSFSLPFYVQHFSTKQYASDHGVSIQMAARALRYAWFEELRLKEGYDLIATAHHLDDHVETFLLNLVRGMGLQGLRGILPKREVLIRPLLFAEVAEVKDEIERRKLKYREDVSNASDKYARNKVRLRVMPLLTELNPQVQQSMAKSISLLKASHDLARAYAEAFRHKEFKPYSTQGYQIDLQALRTLTAPEIMDYLLFEPFGFSATILADFRRSIERPRVGAVFESADYTLSIDRERALLQKRKGTLSEVIIQGMEGLQKIPFQRGYIIGQLLPLPVTEFEAGHLYLDADMLHYPLVIRSWKVGDRLKPIGMNGRSKKVSDVLIGMKIPKLSKDQVPLLVDGSGEIVGLFGFRTCEPFKILPHTKNVLKLTYFYNDEG